VWITLLHQIKRESILPYGWESAIISGIILIKMKIQVDVLECQSGVSKKGNAYNIALVRIPARDGRVGKIFSDIKLEPDTDVGVVMDVAPNAEMFLSPRIKSLAE